MCRSSARSAFRSGERLLMDNRCRVRMRSETASGRTARWWCSKPVHRARSGRRHAQDCAANASRFTSAESSPMFPTTLIRFFSLTSALLGFHAQTRTPSCPRAPARTTGEVRRVDAVRHRVASVCYTPCPLQSTRVHVAGALLVGNASKCPRRVDWSTQPPSFDSRRLHERSLAPLAAHFARRSWSRRRATRGGVSGERTFNEPRRGSPEGISNEPRKVLRRGSPR
jgi:hypothetical protein